MERKIIINSKGQYFLTATVYRKDYMFGLPRWTKEREKTYPDTHVPPLLAQVRAWITEYKIPEENIIDARFGVRDRTLFLFWQEIWLQIKGYLEDWRFKMRYERALQRATLLHINSGTTKANRMKTWVFRNEASDWMPVAITSKQFAEIKKAKHLSHHELSSIEMDKDCLWSSNTLKK